MEEVSLIQSVSAMPSSPPNLPPVPQLPAINHLSSDDVLATSSRIIGPNSSNNQSAKSVQFAAHAQPAICSHFTLSSTPFPDPAAAGSDFATPDRLGKRASSTRPSFSPEPATGLAFATPDRLGKRASSSRPSFSAANRTPGTKRFIDDQPRDLMDRIITRPNRTAREALCDARDCLIEARVCSKDPIEQANILDFYDLFREYIDNGTLARASTIVSSQVQNLELATRSVEKIARVLASTNSSKPTPPSHPKPTPSSQSHLEKPSYAKVASSTLSIKKSNQAEWTLVAKKGPKEGSKRSPNEPDKSRKGNSKRLILIRTAIGPQPPLPPLQTRDLLNNAFKERGIEGPVVATVTKSVSQNVVITTTADYSADYLIEKRDIWEKHITFSGQLQKDEPWFKVVLNGVPTADFDKASGMELVAREVKIFNPGLTPIGTPYWLTSADNRQQQIAGSVCVAFATEAEQSKAIRQRLRVGGISLRVTKFRSIAPTTQCSNCQEFGHLESQCRKGPRCRLCSDTHITALHRCNTCRAKGKCPHMEPKCSNCRQSHTSDDKHCEFYVAARSKASNITTDL